MYWSWPDPNNGNPSKWQFLGHISNSKPSAIFKISQLKKLHELETHETMQFGGSASQIARIGISIETEATIAEQTPATNGDPPTVYSFGQKMLENFVNFASSFSITQAQMVSNPTETYVPLSTLTTWFQNFERRLVSNPNFWK